MFSWILLLHLVLAWFYAFWVVVQRRCQQKGARVLCERDTLQTCIRILSYSCRLSLLLTAVQLFFNPWHISTDVWPTTGSNALDGVWETRLLFHHTQLSSLHWACAPWKQSGTWWATHTTWWQLFTGVSATHAPRTHSQCASLLLELG